MTSRAAARHMIRQRSGVILVFGGYGPPVAKLGGLQVAFGAMESLRRNLARELGPYGIRVAHPPDRRHPRVDPRGVRLAPDHHRSDRRRTMLDRAASLEDVGNVAVFAARDLRARSPPRRSTSPAARSRTRTPSHAPGVTSNRNPLDIEEICRLRFYAFACRRTVRMSNNPLLWRNHSSRRPSCDAAPTARAEMLAVESSRLGAVLVLVTG